MNKEQVNQLHMYQAAKAVYEKEITLLSRVVSNNILTANVFFQCKEKLTQNFFSHQVLYNEKTGIPPELVDFIKLHISALQEAVMLIYKKIKELELQTAAAA